MLATLAILLVPPLTEHIDPSADWVRLAQAGDARAFERVYRLTIGPIHALVLRLVGWDQARADDLTQEVYVRAWQRLASFRFEAKFSTWLHRLALNYVLSALRGAAIPSVELNEQIADDLALDQVRRECDRIDLEKLIARLPPRARTVLVLHEIEGLSHEEIAAASGMAVGSSKAQLHRARALLKRMVEVST